MAAAFIAAGTGIAALAAGGGYIQMESGKKENQVRISLDFSGDREFGKYMEDIGAVQVDLALETPEPEDITRAEFTFEASIQKDPDVKIRDGIFLEDTGSAFSWLGTERETACLTAGKSWSWACSRRPPRRTSPSGWNGSPQRPERSWSLKRTEEEKTSFC